MKWYLAKIVFRIICGTGEHTPQFDEQLRLIWAEDNLEAFYKARQIGECESNIDLGPQVQWKFIDVSELHLLSELTDGAELYSRVNEEDDPDLYIRNTKKRAAHLLNLSLQSVDELN
jgi:hypothetical protein